MKGVWSSPSGDRVATEVDANETLSITSLSQTGEPVYTICHKVAKMVLLALRSERIIQTLTTEMLSAKVETRADRVQ